MEAKWLGFSAETRAKNSLRTAGMGRTRAVGPRVGRQQSRADRGLEGNRRGRIATVGGKNTVGAQDKMADSGGLVAG